MFLLFAGNDYYPKGGAEDLYGVFETVQEAVAHHNTIPMFDYDGGWAHILYLPGGTIVKSFDHGVWYVGSYDALSERPIGKVKYTHFHNKL